MKATDGLLAGGLVLAVGMALAAGILGILAFRDAAGWCALGCLVGFAFAALAALLGTLLHAGD